MKTAALDLGSNSFLCLISERGKDGELRVLEDESIITRLGQSVQKEGKLSKEGLVRAAQAFGAFSELIKKHKVQKVQAVTTAAAREASNFKELIDLGLEYNIPIKLISGEEEAELSFLGAIKEKEKQNSLLIDIGGGSTELAFFENMQKLFLKSLPLGSVRLGEMFVEDWAALTREDLEKMRDQIMKTIEITWGDKKPPKKNWVAVAGTPTSLKAVELGDFNPEKINNAQMTLQDIKRMNQKLIDIPLRERRKVPGLDAKRADVIPVGGLILETLVEWAGVEKITVSTQGLRYGLAQHISKN